jgi:chromosome segregation ATPase
MYNRKSREVRKLEENRMEEMLSTLISMVGNIRKDQESFKIQLNDMQQDIKALQQDMVIVKQDIVEMKHDIKVLQQDMVIVKQDIVEMKQDILEMKQDIVVMKKDIADLKHENKSIKQEISEMKQENEKHHQETLNEFKVLKADLDLIWDKTVRNEREIAKINCQI